MRFLKGIIPTAAARLYRDGAEICPVLGFRPMSTEAVAGGDASSDLAMCRFTVPLGPPVELGEAAEHELVFDNGARFPIRIRQLFIRADDPHTAVRDIFAELI